ncbi:hypothetical protein [Campylobacter pinnipediorum]|uniref:hypothetical protein n=1 Tax=Campylobacter pinnipediorum TaxID=1965231 RepID=UPI001300FE57|nr:hypothetical protein [Campylobacter pinnipediorum]
MLLLIATYQNKFKDIPFTNLENFKELGLDNVSAVNCFQIDSFPSERFKCKLGKYVYTI